MKIAFLAPYSKRHFYRMCGIADASAEGKDVWFFRHMPHNSIEVDVVGCVASLRYKKRVPLVMLQLVSFLPRLNRYDVVMSSGFLNGILFSGMRKVLRLRQQAHVILDTQAIAFLESAGTMRRRLVGFLLSPVDGVICLSRSEQEFWEQHLGLAGKAVFSPFAIDVSTDAVPSAREGEYVFACGATRRDWPPLLSAVRELNVKLIVVAGSDSATGKHGLTGVDVPENVEVLFDIPYAAYKDLLSNALFVVVPLKSVRFTAGLTVITQAMATGKAVIATRNPPLLDYICDGETGLFVRPGDAASLRGRITFLLQNPDEAERIGRNARRAMETELGEKAMGESIWSLLQEICGNANSPGF